ncbi:hypothetical protein HU750_09320 [Pseudomonas sp. SWRI50]|uniref:dermonecrotic toxin domain-containing protein n=1 Tax=Pseudomonas sp. SWRI50 TaxID=2745484 RepID=UPI0016495AFB|nr:DUF6543 domain-containing protein [Pseudomonas sp. SWRI50]MBC3485871.1 hypothetical protein [Pseudomonas sp. SWRI50]
MPMATHSDDLLDELIASRLPNWLASATPERLRALNLCLSQQMDVQQQLQGLYQGTTGLDDFAAPLLQQALHDQQLQLDVSKAQIQLKVVLPAPLAKLLGKPQVRFFKHSLLEAALHNFSAGEAASQDGATLLDENASPLAFAPVAFAELCRTLDVGKQYQDYLKARYQAPLEEGRRVNRIVEEGHRAALEAAVRLSALKGEINERGYQLFLPLMSSVPTEGSDSAVLIPKALRLLGKQIRGAMAFEVRQGGRATAPLEGVICWIPGDEQGALTWYGNWDTLFSSLGELFRLPGYEPFFQRFIGQRDRMAFTQALSKAKAARAAHLPAKLDGRYEAIELPLFEHMRKVQLDTLLDDARVLAVPTADQDSNERNARLHFYLDAGLSVLGLASLFVPWLGLPLLAIAAIEVVSGVYEGYVDWQLGDRQGALEHLLGVAENIALVGVGVGVGVIAGRVLKSAGLVRRLVPVRLTEGQVSLVHPELPGYEVLDDTLAVGERGGEAGQERLRTHTGTYRVAEDPLTRQLCILHPTRLHAYAPLLEHNGAGGWRHALEAVQQWQDAAQMFRRLGSALSDVSDATANDVLHITGFDQARMRRLHAQNAPAPAQLLDALQRYQLHQREPGLHGAAFEQRWQAEQPLASPEARMLRGAFPGLSVRGAQEIVANAEPSLVQRMVTQRKVPMALAGTARWYLRDARVDRACAGLWQASAINADTERLALGLIEGWAPWPEGERVEIRHATQEGELIAWAGANKAGQARIIVRDSDRYQAYANDGTQLTNGVQGESLFEALLKQLDTGQRSVLGQAGQSAAQLTDGLRQRANARHGQAAQLIGLTPPPSSLRPLMRLSGGRLGYPLSGNPGVRLPEEHPLLVIDEAQVRPLLEGLRRLFPAREETTLRQYAQAIASSPRRDVWNHYADLARQVSTLRTRLDTWSLAGDAAQRAAGADRGVRLHWSASRAIMAREILQAWHPQLPGETPTFQLDLDGALTGGLPPFPHTVGWGRLSGLTLRNISATELPPFTAQHFAGLRSLRLINTALEALPQWLLNLEHLTHVSLRSNRLTALPAQLSRMARLSSLDLGHNRLTAIPQVLGQLGELRTLNLESNGIVIDAHNSARLEGMQQLEVLILDGNPLASMPSLVRSIELRRVTLRNTQLQAFPTELLGQHPGMSLALEGNRIVELDDESLRLIARDRARICLDYNPLSQASVQRLDANDRLEPVDPFTPQEGDLIIADDPQRVQALRAILVRIGNQVTNASARLPQHEVLAAHLNVLEQATTLRESLEEWCGDDPGRLAFARRLLASWLPEVPGSVSPPHERHFSLRIDGAQIGSLPQFPDTISWGRLRWLRLVNIDFSSVSPNYFSRFTNLIQLRINNCHLSEVPAWVCDLRRLDDLSLSNNQLVSLPEGLERLTELTTLFLNDNHLTQVPDALRGLGRLQQLGLANNQIVVNVAGAARLNALSALRMLDLNNNPLGSLPTLPQSPSLERVAVANCQLNEFPLALMREHPNVALRLDGNRISELSEEAVRLIRANPQGVNLQLNPLSEVSARRLAAVQPALEPAQPSQPELQPEPQLQAQAARAPERVLVRVANPQAQQHGVEASRDRWLQGLPSPLQQQRQAQWARLTAEPGVEDWLAFLDGLSRTADFQQDVEAIQARVWSLIDACELNERVRGAIFDEAQRDGMAESYLAQLDRLEFARVRALRTEGLQGDDLERAYVQLAREQLSLVQEGRPEALIEALAASRYWQNYLQQRFAERLDSRLSGFHARLDALDAMAISPNDFMQRAAVLAAERNAVFHALIRELTVEACMRHPAQER